MTAETTEPAPANGAGQDLGEVLTGWGSAPAGSLAQMKAGQVMPPKKLTGMRALDFLAKTFPPVQERIQGLAPIEGFAIFAGADKSGKSLSLLQIAICIASGKPWMDALIEQCPVILIEEEGAEHSLQVRLNRQVKALGLLGVDLPLTVYHRSMLKLQDAGWIDALAQEIDETGAKVVLISSLAQVGGIAEENDQREFNAIHDALRHLIDRTHVLVIVAHHCKKPTTKARPRDADAFFITVRDRANTVTMKTNDRPNPKGSEHSAREARVIGYLRCSTEEQADSRAGLEAQRTAILAEAQRRGWSETDLTFVEDAGFSGKNLDRPGIVAALDALRHRRADTLVVSKLDRLWRSMLDFAGLMDRASRERWALVALDLGVVTEDVVDKREPRDTV